MNICVKLFKVANKKLFKFNFFLFCITPEEVSLSNQLWEQKIQLKKTRKNFRLCF